MIYGDGEVAKNQREIVDFMVDAFQPSPENITQVDVVLGDLKWVGRFLLVVQSFNHVSGVCASQVRDCTTITSSSTSSS